MGEVINEFYFLDGNGRVWMWIDSPGSNFHYAYLEWDDRGNPVWTASRSDKPPGVKPITAVQAFDRKRLSVHDINNFLAHLHAQAFPMGAEIEPQDAYDGPAFSIPFSRLPTDTVIRGPRYQVPFERLATTVRPPLRINIP